MKEIGGYLELEHFSGEPYHKHSIALNCGRGCLAYLVELRGIRRVWLPDFMCESVPALFRREGVEVLTYQIGKDLLPVYTSFRIEDGEWLLLCDYYGQLKDEDVCLALSKSSGCLIVDETQGFFRTPWAGADTIYTCRKWFGVADGGYLATSDETSLSRVLPRDESCTRMSFVLGRYERPAAEFYAEASANNAFFADEPAKLMSLLTENILRALDYQEVKARRDSNWDILDATLSDINGLKPLKPNGAFMYPLLIRGASKIRQKLASQGIFIPTLWPNCLLDCATGSVAHDYSGNVLLLPVDQRYEEQDMKYVIEKVLECLN